jgi:2-hydroxy-3-oxopropionate reductase
VKVGFIGLGNMGGPMAANLLRGGVGLSVYNRTRSRAETLAEYGAHICDSPAEVARRADVVLSALADVPASRALFLGATGLAAAARRGQIFADHGTVDLETTREAHAAFARRGAAFLDAPVSGGPEGAREATLSIMAGGEAEAFARARPIFELMGKTVIHMGPSGAGTAAKLANQLLVGVHTLAACEALALGRRAGADFPKLIEVLSRSWGASRMLERCAPLIAKRAFETPGSPLRNILKDLSIVTDLGRRSGLELRAAEAARAVYAALTAEGLGERDITAAALQVEGCERGADGAAQGQEKKRNADFAD